MSFEVRRLDPGLRADFDRVHCAGSEAEWCRCVAWWVPSWDGWGDRTAAANHALREELFARGEYDGYLAYEGRSPLGWCQVGPRDRLAKLVEQFQLVPDAEAWAITCFLVAERERRRGVARALLRGVLDDLPRRGVRRVEAFPHCSGELDELALWNGPERLFLAAGFERVGGSGQRAVLSLELPTS